MALCFMWDPAFPLSQISLSQTPQPIKIYRITPHSLSLSMALLPHQFPSATLHRHRRHPQPLSPIPNPFKSSTFLQSKSTLPSSKPFHRAKAQALAARASSFSSSDLPVSSDFVELPLFPLPLVLFPDTVLPLQIFEFRYRVMMHTLLQTDLRFGVVFSDGGSLANVGCVGEVVKHERLVDDRFFLICKGQERFRVSRVLRSKPYLVAEVAWLEDRPPLRLAEGEDLDSLASEVENYMRDVIRISKRLNGKPEKEGSMDLRRNLFPTTFSFLVGSTFEGAPREQQALLELEDTGARLRRERDTLRNTLNYLTAASAVKDAFSPSNSS